MPDLFTTSVIGDPLTLSGYITCTVCALILGIIIVFTTTYRNNCSKGFLLSIFILPVIIETVILLVNGNIGTGLAVMGAFSLIRFRSVPGSARNIVSIFTAMAAGLACATGFIALALLFTVLICTVSMLFIKISKIPSIGANTKTLKITVPEALNYANAFNGVFDAYTVSHDLISSKTTNMGSLYKLNYRVELKAGINEKEFIDALRCLNGNLEIMLGIYQNETEAL